MNTISCDRCRMGVSGGVKGGYVVARYKYVEAEDECILSPTKFRRHFCRECFNNMLAAMAPHDQSIQQLNAEIADLKAQLRNRPAAAGVGHCE